MRAPAIGIKKPALHQAPANILVVLPRVIERIAPPARTHLVHVLRIADRPPYPANAGVPCRVEVLCVGNIHAAHPDIEGVLAHIAVHRLDELGEAVLRHTNDRLPRIFCLSVVRFRRGRLSTNHVYLVLNEIRVPILDIPPRSLGVTAIISTLREYYLYPHLLIRLQDAHALQDFRQRINPVFFFRILVELELDIGAFPDQNEIWKHNLPLPRARPPGNRRTSWPRHWAATGASTKYRNGSVRQMRRSRARSMGAPGPATRY